LPLANTKVQVGQPTTSRSPSPSKNKSSANRTIADRIDSSSETLEDAAAAIAAWIDRHLTDTTQTSGTGAPAKG
jgi:hypothetical protein